METWKKAYAVGLASILAFGSASLPGAFAAKPSAGTKSTITDGAVYTNFRPASDVLGVQENETWSFDPAQALISWQLVNANPLPTTVSCSGGGCKDQTLLIESSRTIAFTGPAPALVMTQSNWNIEQCSFWTGDTLGSYTMKQSISDPAVGSGGSKYQITRNYDFVYEGTGIEPKAFWTLVGQSEPGTVKVNFGGKIAGLSGMTWTGGYKYSFSISSGVIDNPTLVVTPVNSDGSLGAPTSYPLSYQYLNALSDGFSDFGIGQVTNGYGYGYNLNQILSPPDILSGVFPSTGSIPAQDARAILNSDAHLGNDNGGSDGSALAYIQLLPFQVDLPAGNFQYSLQATVKGLSGVTDGNSITVARRVNYIGLDNCQ
ncbi:MAG: hypothetical protein ACKOXT_04355 [Actinomycetota bacterium]